MANQFYVHERIPNSPFLNENFYVVFSFPGLASFTNAVCSVASVISPISASGASFIAFYPAGTVATGIYTIYGHMVKGSTGTHVVGPTIQIRNSDIADPVITVYSLIKNNIGSTYSSTAFSTGWYDPTRTVPVVTVTRGRWTDDTANLFDTFREHEDTVYVDTWVPNRAFGRGLKSARNALDNEVKRIINANRKAPSAKIRHLQIVNSQELNEITDNRKMFRTRHSVRIKWDETVS